MTRRVVPSTESIVSFVQKLKRIKLKTHKRMTSVFFFKFLQTQSISSLMMELKRPEHPENI